MGVFGGTRPLNRLTIVAPDPFFEVDFSHAPLTVACSEFFNRID